MAWATAGAGTLRIVSRNSSEDIRTFEYTGRDGSIVGGREKIRVGGQFGPAVWT